MTYIPGSRKGLLLRMRYVMGVDAGATKTFAAVGDDSGRYLSTGRGGPGNHQAKGGVERAMGCIAEAVESACQAAGLAVTDLAHVTFCLAGADLPSDYALLEGAIHSRWPSLRFQVKNDTFAGLRAGATKGWGVVSICGTGTNAAGIAPDGRDLALAGLGYLFGDFGGAADLGREAIRAVHQAAELRGPATALTEPVLAHMGVGSVDELREALYLGKAETARIPRIAPLVFAAANQGDAVAQAMLLHMGTLLGQSVGGVIRQLGMEQEAVDVVLAGSTWKGENPLLVDAFQLAVHRVAPRAQLVRPRYEPVVGALLLAVEVLGVKPDDWFYAELDATLPPELWVAASTKEEAP